MAQTLTVLAIWDHDGAWRHRFCLVQTFPEPGNRDVRNTDMRLMAEDGTWYYTSFPPFAVIVPHVILQLLSPENGVLPLQVLNLVLHGASALLLFAALILGLPPRPNRSLAALAGAALFVFLEPSLWFHGSFYSWDTFWQYLWIGAILQGAWLLRRVPTGRVGPGGLAGLGLLHALLLYSEFQGVFVSLTLAALFWFDSRDKRAALVVLGAAALAVGGTLWQYASIAGFGPLLDTLGTQARRRSFLHESPLALLHLAWLYLRTYGPGMLPAAFAALVLGAQRRGPLRVLEGERALLLLAGVPVVCHNLLMLQWTVYHPHGLLKLAVFLPVLTAVLAARFLGSPELAQPLPRRAFLAVLLLSLMGSSISYSRRHRVAHGAEAMQDLGERMRQLADDEQVLLAFSARRIQKQVIHAARRNIQRVQSLDQARAWLEEHGHRRGIVFWIGEQHELERWERIAVPDERPAGLE